MKSTRFLIGLALLAIPLSLGTASAARGQTATANHPADAEPRIWPIPGEPGFDRVFSHHKVRKLAMPVLALGGSSGNGTVPLQQMRLAATDVQGGVIEDCGHWIPTERPAELTRRLIAFFGTTAQPPK